MRVLVVDDDMEVRELLTRAITRDGHTVTAVGAAAAARDVLDATGADVMVLDLDLPDDTGVALCRALRADGFTLPILMLTAHSEIAMRVASFDAGVDDFLAKPFAVVELCARVRALARRRSTTFAVPMLVRGDLRVDFTSRRAQRGDAVVSLTSREWALLDSLALRRGRVVPRAELLCEVWGEASEASSASLDVLVGRIRRKLASDVVRTLRNEGYALEIA